MTIETGNCYTTTKGAFLDGIYATASYVQEGGDVTITIGDCEVIGASVFIENLAVCSDGAFTVKGGSFTASCGPNTANGKAVGAKTIDFGKAKITAGADAKGTDASYTDQKYVKAVY